MRAAVVVLGLIALLGCRARDSSAPSSVAGDGGQGGTAGAPPQQPPQQDSSIDDRLDAADIDSATPAELPPNFVLACDDEPPSDPGDDVVAAWEAERDAHGTMGYAASFALQGATYLWVRFRSAVRRLICSSSRPAFVSR